MGECPACAEANRKSAAALVPPFARNAEEAIAGLMRERDAALAAAEALEARYVAGIRHALRTLHAVHGTLPDGDMVPRQSADALALAVEGALLAMLPEVES
jgi:hypothetical protein